MTLEVSVRRFSKKSNNPHPNFITEALREGLGVEDIHVQCGIDDDVIRREVERLGRMGVLRELTQMPKREACA